MNDPAPSDNRHLRVGNSTRERALEQLRNAAADERITFEELDGRVARVVASVTRGDLADVLGDLMTAAELDEFLGEDAPSGEGPGYTWDEPLLIRARDWNTTVVAGPWDVPPFMEVMGAFGGVVIDFTQGMPKSKVIDLVLNNSSYGTILLVVPEGWGVDVSSVQADSSTTIASEVPTRPRRGLPRIVIRGRSNGQVKARTPKPSDLRRAAKHVAKGRPALPPA